ncbi:hypothetical protein GC093_28645 [Paenibacillus sp. LMG 31456]|uniref:Uncharacterized protein n=1 Tax=Paenibacillus foliorum TaxID=2654974 RepID=A0A972K3N7_9BACL|nr:hypothetical protein [Paenibacillus foliorum]NOU97165.1 hypothetical protein [Paenibacillus foliorum]
MTKPIQAYFRTENEAEDVRILLQKYDTEMLEIGEIEENGLTSNSELVVPLGAAISPVGTGGAGAIAFSQSNEGYDPLLGASIDNQEDELDDFRYVLSVKVNESDFGKVVQLIQNNNGHVLRTD